MPTQHCTRTDGTRIVYDATGNGPAILLLHGAGKTRKDWHTLGYVARLAVKNQVIAIDLPGTGESDKPHSASDYSVDKMCSDVAGVADACGISRFMLCGYDFGGNIARYVAAYSDRVRALVLIGVPFGPAVRTEFARRINDLENRFSSAIDLVNRGCEDSVPLDIQLEIRAHNLDVWLPCFQAMRTYPVVQPVDVHCPALILAGSENAETVAWISSHQTALRNAGTRVELIQGLDHQTEFTDIDRVLPPILAFLESISADT